jgi:cation diffusion facilitator CzcD-associated flavoprotein CzcO
MGNETENGERGRLDRRGVFRGAAALGGLGAAGLLVPVGPSRALAAGGAKASDAVTAKTLAVDAERALRWSAPVPAAWVPSRKGADYNVVVVGAGHSGTSLTYWLSRRGIDKVLTIDQAEPGHAGIWRDIGRMNQLNTSKTLAGPARDHAALSFRAWYETLHGTAAFDALDRIPRLAWADYLEWFRQTTGIQVQYRTRLLDIEPVGELLRLHVETQGAVRTVTTRKIVLANGYLGAGGTNVPDFIQKLPSRLWSHTGTPFPLAPLAGKVVGVVGAGASAFDAAGAALEAGAAEVHLFSRKGYINYKPATGTSGANPATAYPGPPGLGYTLPEEIRWRDQVLRNRSVSSVMEDEVRRAVKSDRFQLHLNASLADVAVGSDGRIAGRVGTTPYKLDFLIAGTGYRVDVSTRPELARFHRSISLWGDRFRPAPGEENEVGNYFPYLGAGFQFQPREGVTADFLRNIHVFNPAGRLSFDTPVSDIGSAALYPVLVEAIARDFFLEGAEDAASKRVRDAASPAQPDPAVYQRAVRA